MFGCMNLGKYFIEPAFMSLLDYFAFLTLNIFGLMYEAIFIKIIYKKMLEIDSYDTNLYKIISDSDVEEHSLQELALLGEIKASQETNIK